MSSSTTPSASPTTAKHKSASTTLSTSTTVGSSPIIIASPSVISIEPEDERDMEKSREEATATTQGAIQTEQEQKSELNGSKDESKGDRGKNLTKAKKRTKDEKQGKKTRRRKLKAKHVKAHKSDEDTSSVSDSSSTSERDDSDDESSEDEKERRRRKKKALRKRKEETKKLTKAKAKAKKKKKKKSKKLDDASSESDSDSSFSSESSTSSDSEEDKKRRKKTSKKRHKKSKKDKYESSSVSSSSSDSTSSDEGEEKKGEPAIATAERSVEDMQVELEAKKAELAQLQVTLLQRSTVAGVGIPPAPIVPEAIIPKKKTVKGGKSKADYKRVDQVWDVKLRDYRYTESAVEKLDDFDCVFTVRRKFNWENKYQYTLVDIKSSLLKESLMEIMKDVKGQSLEEETPSLDPNLLFLYHDEIKTYYRKTLKRQLKKHRKRKHKKRLTQKIAHCKLLSGYLEKDYENTRKRLDAMLTAGNITWELTWALFKPNTIAYTPTYGNKDDPRCFKVDYAFTQSNWMDEEWWRIEGRYLEYDGKKFGFGDHAVHINHFKGPRKITSLATYPLSYHKDPEGLEKELIERGKKFVALQGMNYRFQKGLAYQKRRTAIAKINVNGRIMVDPAIFRRINPNYLVSYIKHKEDDQADDDCDCSHDSSDEDNQDSESEEETRVVVFKDKNNGKLRQMVIPAGDRGPDLSSQKLESLESEDGTTHTFTEEELLIASPVVLGFAFTDKMWLEFSLSGITEIEWNEDAFDSLVLPAKTKQNLKSMVSSHRFNAAKTIDDVIQGKGKGLNVVLHGPPGVGKTLTGESIADFLKCPLYAVSAGELGTNSRALEADLNRIMDITHSWGAILLLDEADVFLEQRQAQDVHRNALVSVFLRLLEYYQGILFLTTNRVSTFDEAFQSRIHMGIGYKDLDGKARKEIWKHHIKKIEKLEDQQHETFAESDFNELSKKVLNGRQIKNTVITAQSCALAESKPFSMEFIKRLLDVQEEFEADMKGGMGYRDAMRQYT